VRARRAAVAAALAALVVAAGGCGGDDGGDSPPAPEAAGVVVTEFSRALGSGDGEKACGLLTSGARAAFIKRVETLAGTKDCATALTRVHDAAGAEVNEALSTATVSDVRVNGDSATAKLTAAGHATSVSLQKEDGDWKLTGVPGIQ
jgi:hypothetical protein